MENQFLESYLKGLGKHNTVSNGADNGANNCMAGKFQNCMRHGTTEQMVNNLVGRLNSKIQNCNIGGHGYDGLLETGAGQSGYGGDKKMFVWNQYQWEPFLEKLKPYPFEILTIFSCYTGAGEDGADFLHNIAKVINKPVRARTGLTSCGSRSGITFESGSQWQLATPTHRPNPIPRTGTFLNPKATSIMEIERNNVISTLDVNNVLSIKITTNTNEEPKSIIHNRPDVTSMLLASPKMNIEGELLALCMYKMSIETKIKGLELLELDILGDRIAYDKISQTYYYLPSSVNQLF